MSELELRNPESNIAPAEFETFLTPAEAPWKENIKSIGTLAAFAALPLIQPVPWQVQQRQWNQITADAKAKRGPTDIMPLMPETIDRGILDELKAVVRKLGNK